MSQPNSQFNTSSSNNSILDDETHRFIDALSDDTTSERSFNQVQQNRPKIELIDIFNYFFDKLPAPVQSTYNITQQTYDSEFSNHVRKSYSKLEALLEFITTMLYHLSFSWQYILMGCHSMIIQSEMYVTWLLDDRKDSPDFDSVSQHSQISQLSGNTELQRNSRITFGSIAESVRSGATPVFSDSESN